MIVQSPIRTNDSAVETIIEDFRHPDTAREDPDGAPLKPCSIGALGSAASGGFIGGLYGAGSKLLMHRGSGRLLAARKEALSSAKPAAASAAARNDPEIVLGFHGYLILVIAPDTVFVYLCRALSIREAFAVFGGVYAFASCVIQRLRNKEDIWTSGLAGCSTGLVMGISSGFQGALASAAMMGGFSVVIDLMGKSEAQALALPDHTTGRIKKSVKETKRRTRHPVQSNWRQWCSADCALCPALPLPLRLAEEVAKQAQHSFRAKLMN